MSSPSVSSASKAVPIIHDNRNTFGHMTTFLTRREAALALCVCRIWQNFGSQRFIWEKRAQAEFLQGRAKIGFARRKTPEAVALMQVLVKVAPGLTSDKPIIQHRTLTAIVARIMQYISEPMTVSNLG